MLSQSDINCGTSEGSQSLVRTNIDSAVISKDQGLNSGVSEAATATSGSMPLSDGINKLDLTCQSKDGGLFVSTDNPNLDEVPASDNISKGPSDNDPSNPTSELSTHVDNPIASENTQSLPVSDSDSIKTGKCQYLQSANIQLASAVGATPLPGESGKYGCPSGNESNRITDSSESSNPNVSLVSVKLFECEKSDSISGTMKSAEDESVKVVVNEHETNTPDEVPVSSITTIEEVCTEPDLAPAAAILPSVSCPIDVSVGSEQGVTMSSLTASAHASTDPMAVASSDQLAPDISMSSVRATEEDVLDPSAGQVPEGKLLAL